MCLYDEKNVKNIKEDEEISKVVDDVSFNLRQSIDRSLNGIEKIKYGELAKRSYKHMIERVKQKLDEEKQ